MTTGDDRLAVERAEPRPSEAVPDEDRKPSGSERSKDTARKEDEEIDEALDETFPASDPPSYSKGLPKTE